jgi:hypothetical protein
MANQKLQVARAAAVTPSNTVDIPYVGGGDIKWACVLYIGTGGNIRLLTDGEDDVTFFNVLGGTFLPVQVKRVFVTGTTASNIVALW